MDSQEKKGLAPRDLRMIAVSLLVLSLGLAIAYFGLFYVLSHR